MNEYERKHIFSRFAIDAMHVPEFVRGFSNLTTYEGEQVRFEVEVRGDPAPSLSWYRDGEIIRDSPDFQVSEINFDHTSLIIVLVQLALY